MGDIEDQIGDMLKMYELKPEEEEVVDEPVVEEPTEEPVDDIPPEEPTEEVTPPSTPEPEPEDELTILKRDNAEFKRKLDEILARPTEAPKPVIPEPEAVPEVIPEQDFLGDTDIDDLINDSKKFNLLLNKVFQKGIEIATKKQDELRRTLPSTIKETVTTVETLRKASEQFYAENADLVPFKGAVATVFNEIASLNPTWDYTKLLKESEVETRKRLNLIKSDKPITTPKKDVPSLPNRRSQQRAKAPEKQTDPLLSDIDAMNEVLYRR